MKLVYLIITNSYELSENQIAPQIKVYQSYKSFNIDNFKSNLNQKLNLMHCISTTYDDFEETFLSLLNKLVPLKKNILRHNNAAFIPKQMTSKANDEKI